LAAFAARRIAPAASVLASAGVDPEAALRRFVEAFAPPRPWWVRMARRVRATFGMT
jgi:hypothetical protein